MSIQNYDDLLQTEIDFYERERRTLLLEYPNRILLIHGENVEGDFDTQDAAVAEGVARFGSEPFLVRRSGEDTPLVSAPALTLGALSADPRA